MSYAQSNAKKVRRIFQVEIDDEDRVKYANELAVLSEDQTMHAIILNSKTSEYKTLKEEETNTIGALQIEINKVHRILREKKHDREIECMMVKNFEANAIEFWDGDELLDQKPMTAEERQAEMDLPSEPEIPLPERESELEEEAGADLTHVEH